jgi:hypothetical protein
MWWPGGDPYWTYNTIDPVTRMNYYGLNWVPYLAIDGDNSLNVGDESVSVWEAAITEQMAIGTAPLGIAVTGDMNYQAQGTLDVTLTPETGVTGDYTLHVVLVEDDLYYMGSNGFPHHEAVMRHMFPGAGTPISLEADVEFNTTIDLQITQNFDLENCRLVVFVQAPDQTVINAANYHITELTPVNVPKLSSTNQELYVVDENGDGKLNPGESTNYAVTILNQCDWAEAVGTTGYLSSTSPYVTITDSVGTYDPIGSCNTAINTADMFAFSISEDAPVIAELPFSLRLTTNQDGEVPYESTIPLTVGMDMFQLHFPVSIDYGVVSGSAVIDLDNDGSMEVVFGGLDSMLHVLSLDGTEFAGFPFMADSKITSAPAIGDVDNDGELEIVFVSLTGGIYVIQSDGMGELVARADDNILGTPAIDDLDGDGDLEIVAAGFGYDLVAIHHDGTPLTGFPIIMDSERMEGAAGIADIDGDGAKDIIVGTKGDFLHVFDANGNSLAGFPVDVGNDIKTPPVITDLTGDGTLEIITGQRSGIVYALAHSGAVLWTHQLAAVPILTPPAVLDYNQDGLMETVYVLPDGRVSVLDHAGNMMEGWPQTLASTCYSSPIIADVDGDEVPEIILGDDSNDLYAFHIDGTLLPNYPLAQGARVHCAATIADMDLDGNMEIIVGTDAGLSIVDMLANSQVGPYWFTSRGNYKRTGYFPNNIASSVHTPIIPDVLTLSQNYPNPFNPTTSIEFGLPEASETNLTIFDVRGNEVSRLIDGSLSPGNYSLQWNSLDGQGNPVAAGIYFARIQTSAGEQVIKMTLIK